MIQLKLGDWSIPAGAAEYPPVGTSYVKSILGANYSTAIMPGGLEWMAANLGYDGVASYARTRGRVYLDSGVLTLESILTGGWRLPSFEEFGTMALSLDPSVTYIESNPPIWALAGGFLKTITEWASPNAGASNTYGFSFYPETVGGTQASMWLSSFAARRQKVGMTSGAANATLLESSLTAETLSFVRLVRDPDPIGPPTEQLNSYHDILVLPSGQAETTESLAQRVDIRLRTFAGEHWLNPELGVPWFEEFLRKSPDLAVCRQILVTVLQDVPGVEEVHSLAVDFAKSSRQMRVSFVVSGSDSIPQQGATVVTL